MPKPRGLIYCGIVGDNNAANSQGRIEIEIAIHFENKQDCHAELVEAQAG